MPLFGKRKDAGSSADLPQPSGPGFALLPLLSGDQPMADWPPDSAAGKGEPWDSFFAARQASVSGRHAQAVEIWKSITEEAGIESRHVLQAWTFLRATGVQPLPEHAKQALAVIVHIPIQNGHDTLAAYRDGSVRYINYSGAAVVIDQPPADVADAANTLLTAGQSLADRIGPWTEPMPPLPSSTARILVLTPSGPHFGQGRFAQLLEDPMATPTLNAARDLLGKVVALAD